MSNLIAKQGILYLLIGAGTALLELGLFQLLFLIVGLPVEASNIIAVVVATACNFALNGTVTFKGSTNLIRSIVLYALLFLFNTAFSTLVIAWLVDIGVTSLFAKLATMVCIVCWNFVLYRKVVFI